MRDLMNISAFLIGASTMFYTIFAVHILYWRSQRTYFQTILGCILALWAFSNLKDMILTFPGMYTESVLNWVFMIDGWGALTYTVFVFETVTPRWLNVGRFSLHALPFAAFTLLYICQSEQWVIYGYAAFLWFYAWGVVCVGYVKMRRHLAYVRKNFSNIDNIDVSWLKPVFFFAVVTQLAWLFTSLIADVAADIVYYVMTILMWLFVLKYSWNFRPIEVERETDQTVGRENGASVPISAGLLEEVVETQQLYLKKNLALSDLAQALKTNRTYVSNYLSQVRGQTFYDYINQMRIEKKSIPMMLEHPEYTLDYVAQQSGFASISTFRRAFVKLTGQTPREFIADSTLEP